jgi:uncharacterized protein
MLAKLAPVFRPFLTARTGHRPVTIWGASRRVEAPDRAASLRSRAKFLVRAWARPGLTRFWLSRLTQADVAPLWALRPRLATKLQRPYVSSEWGAAERFAALLGHYDLLPRLLSAGALEVVYAGGLDLVHLHNTATGRTLALRLFYQDQFEKEGELTLAVVDTATELSLAGLTFCLARNEGRPLAIIGGVQANPDPRVRGLIHDVAKELHGLRPKALALWALQQLAVAWDLKELQGVCDAQHIYRHRHKRRAIAASYDEFWRESDGRQLPGGGWTLPLQPRVRSREELKASRRKQHERRYALLGAVQVDLFAALGDLAPGTRILAAGPRIHTFASRETGAATPETGTAAKSPATPGQTIPPACNHSY